MSVLVFAGCASLPKAQSGVVYEPQFVFKNNGHTITSLSTTVSSTYNIEVCVDAIPEGWSMTGFDVRFQWTPISHLEVVNVEPSIPTPPGSSSATWDNSLGVGQEDRHGIDTKTLSLFVVTIHCLAEGTATMTFRAPPQVTIDITPDVPGEPAYGEIGPTPLVINQHVPAPPSGPSGYVGGEVFTANKLAVLSPYLALIGLVAVAAFVLKKRKT